MSDFSLRMETLGLVIGRVWAGIPWVSRDFPLLQKSESWKCEISLFAEVRELEMRDFPLCRSPRVGNARFPPFAEVQELEMRDCHSACPRQQAKACSFPNGAE